MEAIQYLNEYVNTLYHNPFMSSISIISINMNM